jgi:hypothetical protein
MSHTADSKITARHTLHVEQNGTHIEKQKVSTSFENEVLWHIPYTFYTCKSFIELPNNEFFYDAFEN